VYILGPISGTKYCLRQKCSEGYSSFRHCSTACFISKVQSVQNAAARLLNGTRRGDHISPVLRQLHWLSVQRRVDFKLACFIYLSLFGQAPPYLADDIHLVSEGPRRRLRSFTDRLCVVPYIHNTLDRNFAAARPRVWNSLPLHLRDEDTTL